MKRALIILGLVLLVCSQASGVAITKQRNLDVDSITADSGVYVSDDLEVTGDIAVGGTVDTVNVGVLGATVEKITDDTTKFYEAYDSSQAHGTHDDYLPLVGGSTTGKTQGKFYDSDTTKADSVYVTKNYADNNNVVSTNPNFIGDVTHQGEYLKTDRITMFDAPYIWAVHAPEHIKTLPIEYYETADIGDSGTALIDGGELTEPWCDSAVAVHPSVHWNDGKAFPFLDEVEQGDDSCLYLRKHGWIIYTPYMGSWMESPTIAWFDSLGGPLHRPYKIDTTGEGYDTIYAPLPLCNINDLKAGDDEVDADMLYQSDPWLHIHTDQKMYCIWRANSATTIYILVKSSWNGIDWSAVTVVATGEPDGTISGVLMSPGGFVDTSNTFRAYTIEARKFDGVEAVDSNGTEVMMWTARRPDTAWIPISGGIDSFMTWIDTTYSGYGRHTIDSGGPNWATTTIDTVGFLTSIGWTDDKLGTTDSTIWYPWHFSFRRFNGEYHCFITAEALSLGKKAAENKRTYFARSTDGERWTWHDKPILRRTGYDHHYDSLFPGHFAGHSVYHGSGVPIFDGAEWCYAYWYSAFGRPHKSSVNTSIGYTEIHFEKEKDIKTISRTVMAPADLITDEFEILRVDSINYPHGIMIYDIEGSIDHDTAYAFDVEAWTGARVFDYNIDNLNFVSGSDTLDFVYDNTKDSAYLPPGHLLYIDLPADSVDFCKFQIRYSVMKSEIRQ